MSIAPITCTDLTKRFGSLIALESVSFSLERPAVVGLVGPNGSGKSTLLRLLMGALRPSSGEVHLYGHAPRESRLRYTNVGYLSASDRMFPELTVLENMIYRGQLFGLDHQEGSTMAARLLRERNLYGLRDRRPETLSTGQRRQVLLLSVLMHQPKILFLDEPTTGIDITAISQIYQLMSELCEEDCSILLATHNIEELVTLCSRTLALHDGQLVFDRPTVELGRSRAEVRDTLQYLFLGSDAPSRAPSIVQTDQSEAAPVTELSQDRLPRTDERELDPGSDPEIIEFELSDMEYGIRNGRAAS